MRLGSLETSKYETYLTACCGKLRFPSNPVLSFTKTSLVSIQFYKYKSYPNH